MSSCAVVLESLDAHAEQLNGFSPAIDDLRGRLSGGAEAATATPASGALEDLSHHLVARLAEYGRAADALHRTVVASRARYAATETGIKTSAT